MAIVNNLPAGVMVMIDGNNKVRDGSTVKPVVADQQKNGDKVSGHKHKNQYKHNDKASNKQPKASAVKWRQIPPLQQ